MCNKSRMDFHTLIPYAHSSHPVVFEVKSLDLSHEISCVTGNASSNVALGLSKSAKSSFNFSLTLSLHGRDQQDDLKKRRDL